MKPGATTWPPASITRRASPWSPEPTATTRSPSTATSARRAGAPVPSMTEPFLMSSDQIIPALRFDDRHRRHSITLPDAVHVLHAGDGASKHGVVSVEMGRGAVADVELAARGVGVLAPRHRDAAAHVLLRVELGGDRVARTAGALAFGAAALDDEVRDDAVEGEPVVEPPLGERHKVRDGRWRVLWEELDPDLAPLLERDYGRRRLPLRRGRGLRPRRPPRRGPGAAPRRPGGA